VERFRDAYEKAVKQHGKPEILSSEETKRRIIQSEFTQPEGKFDEFDPLH
jgi:hypothetical protein